MERLYQRGVDARLVFSEGVEKIEEEFRVRENELTILQDNMIELIKSQVEEYRYELYAYRESTMEQLNEKFTQFEELNEENEIGIEDLNAVQGELKETLRGLGLTL